MATNGNGPQGGAPPIAVVSFACRLPGQNNDPETLWRYLEQGRRAATKVPENRFSLRTHYDGSKRAPTMKGSGGMFLEDVDLARFDAPFFNISAAEARSMDPQQRQLLEVVYEGLENGGITLDEVSGAQVGCFVSSYTMDYLTMQSRDPDSRPANTTTGTGRAILSNRISHYLNIKGPSITIDTGCSGGLVGVDMACRYLADGDISAAIISSSHLWMNPDDLTEEGPMGSVYSVDSLCQVFDSKANGYVKAEAVNVVILKRLDDAIASGDPIRAIIRGSASNSNGATLGISSPSKEAQAACIRSAYARAGITDKNATSFVECHGTGTQAGDPIEVNALNEVFGSIRDAAQPLIIGSVKSNLGHSEPAAGLTGLVKAVLSIEKGKIPGQPTFAEPNPKLLSATKNMHIPKKTMAWPAVPLRRASVNSFGFGGANAHVIVEESKGYLGSDWAQTHVTSQDSQIPGLSLMARRTQPQKLYTLVFSAGSEESLKAYYARIKRHLANFNVRVRPSDLAYTLGQRRSHHSCRAYAVTSAPNLGRAKVEFGEKSLDTPRIAFVFTGQGSQWPQMGAGLIKGFPCVEKLLRHLDTVLQSTPTPPSWSILEELSEPRKPEYYQRPELSQPLTTAVQLAILAILQEWGVQPMAVVGHSSGEIAAACAAGYLSPEQAILAAFYRGQTATVIPPSASNPLGMLAVGAGPEKVAEQLLPAALAETPVACVNSPNSVTLSGPKSILSHRQKELEEQGYFARLLRVDLAYHSKYVSDIADLYKTQLQTNWASVPGPAVNTTTTSPVQMFSSVTGHLLDQPCDAEYWRTNMTSPVLFANAAAELVQDSKPTLLLEVGPSGALAGPVREILDGISAAKNVQYLAALQRGGDTAEAMHELAGKLFLTGYPISLRAVNFPAGAAEGAGAPAPSVITDLPNYSWDHSATYWHESQASQDWRFSPFPHHELLGRKILGTPWTAPSWKSTIRLDDIPWLNDHRMAGDAVFPGAGYLAMAIEALYQARQTVNPIPEAASVADLQFVLRDVSFRRALALVGSEDRTVVLTFTDVSEGYTSWTGFRVLSVQNGISTLHCDGSIRLKQVASAAVAEKDTLVPLHAPESATHWYRALDRRGCSYGPDFQRLLDIECLAGQQDSRATFSQEPPATAVNPHKYPVHPALIDIAFQSTFPALYSGLRSEIVSLLLPSSMDELTIGPIVPQSSLGPALSLAQARHNGTGQAKQRNNHSASATVWNMETGHALLEFKGLHFSELRIDDTVDSDPELFAPAWLPDLDFLPQDQFLQVLRPEATVSDLINLIAFKTPRLRVGEINLTTDSSSSTVWFEQGSSSLRDAHEHYTYVDADPVRSKAVRSLVGSRPNAEFKLLGKDSSPIFAEPSPDLVLVQHQDLLSSGQLQTLERIQQGKSEGQGLYLFVQHAATAVVEEKTDEIHLHQAGYTVLFKIPVNGSSFAYLCRSTVPISSTSETTQPETPTVSIISGQPDSELVNTVTQSLQDAGYLTQMQTSFSPLAANAAAVVVLDNFASPVLANVGDDQWENIRSLVLESPSTLWVTQGSQHTVTNPNGALIHGLSRSIRAENPTVRLVTLDVEAPVPVQNASSIVQLVAKRLVGHEPQPSDDFEFAERGGIVHVSRILRTSTLRELEDRQTANAVDSAKTLSMHAMTTHVQLRTEHIGSLDSLQLYEVPGQEDLLPDQVEIEVHATGLNFKDIAVSTGLIAGDDHALGLEGAGIVKRVGQDVHDYQVGDRVAFLDRGAFTNRARVAAKRVYRLPEGMAFEVAAAIPVIFATAVYALVKISGLRKGQSVLIHSGAGGVGIAAIQLSQYLGAEVYTTVGSEEKRVFLQENLHIPPGHIFSSRNTSFAEGILAATDGKGVDVILNSVTGELLDETWRICADGGIMVDIGRGLRNRRLPSSPFERNCSIKAFDLMHKQIPNDLIQELLADTFTLFQSKNLHFAHPVRTFSYAQIRDAFDHLSTGRHIGKIVVSDESPVNADATAPSVVSVASAPPSSVIRTDKSYLIAGGLHGVCGTLAIYLALRGARSIVTLSRSGASSPKAAGTIQACQKLGCDMTVVKGDVTSLDAVKDAIAQSPLPVCGIIHGAMVLRDTPYELMDAHAYRSCIAPKVQGAWNLHHASVQLRLELDFFTLLSSISGVVGQRGQANYAAANCFLDSFAAYRQSLGLPGLALDLGAVLDIGVITENPELRAYFANPQWLQVEQKELFYIMDASITQQQQQQQQSSAQLIMALSYPLPSTSDLLQEDIRLTPLSRAGTASQQPGSSSNAATEESHALAKFLHLHSSGGADPTSLTAAAVELFESQLMRMLRLDSPIKANKPLSAYGMDSLSAVKFRNWVERSFHVTFAVFEVLGAVGLQALCAKLVTRLDGVV
ncbi:hypothetical protein FE257_006541 [Aspergillus nanangensis]|uniref:Carrier domain-containing protein n=1 Tax=Aspergillus nanangensis TaxID=2582783 RepID=A0AAD4CY77_ASPNN|nr:hypothetical protein FE257_006541 [Aspergillus nanangensis]QGW49095.1 putative polyketide synthase [Aspergillus nanangensis]